MNDTGSSPHQLTHELTMLFSSGHLFLSIYSLLVYTHWYIISIHIHTNSKLLKISLNKNINY